MVKLLFYGVKILLCIIIMSLYRMAYYSVKQNPFLWTNIVTQYNNRVTQLILPKNENIIL